MPAQCVTRPSSKGASCALAAGLAQRSGVRVVVLRAHFHVLTVQPAFSASEGDGEDERAGSRAAAAAAAAARRAAAALSARRVNDWDAEAREGARGGVGEAGSDAEGRFGLEGAAEALAAIRAPTAVSKRYERWAMRTVRAEAGKAGGAEHARHELLADPETGVVYEARVGGEVPWLVPCGTAPRACDRDGSGAVSESISGEAVCIHRAPPPLPEPALELACALYAERFKQLLVPWEGGAAVSGASGDLRALHYVLLNLRHEGKLVKAEMTAAVMEKLNLAGSVLSEMGPAAALRAGIADLLPNRSAAAIDHVHSMIGLTLGPSPMPKDVTDAVSDCAVAAIVTALGLCGERIGADDGKSALVTKLEAVVAAAAAKEVAEAEAARNNELEARGAQGAYAKAERTAEKAEEALAEVERRCHVHQNHVAKVEEELRELMTGRRPPSDEIQQEFLAAVVKARRGLRNIEEDVAHEKAALGEAKAVADAAKAKRDGCRTAHEAAMVALAAARAAQEHARGILAEVVMDGVTHTGLSGALGATASTRHGLAETVASDKPTDEKPQRARRRRRRSLVEQTSLPEGMGGREWAGTLGSALGELLAIMVADEKSPRVLAESLDEDRSGFIEVDEVVQLIHSRANSLPCAVHRVALSLFWQQHAAFLVASMRPAEALKTLRRRVTFLEGKYTITFLLQTLMLVQVEVVECDAEAGSGTSGTRPSRVLWTPPQPKYIAPAIITQRRRAMRWYAESSEQGGAAQATQDEIPHDGSRGRRRLLQKYGRSLARDAGARRRASTALNVDANLSGAGQPVMSAATAAVAASAAGDAAATPRFSRADNEAAGPDRQLFHTAAWRVTEALAQLAKQTSAESPRRFRLLRARFPYQSPGIVSVDLALYGTAMSDAVDSEGCAIPSPFREGVFVLELAIDASDSLPVTAGVRFWPNTRLHHPNMRPGVGMCRCNEHFLPRLQGGGFHLFSLLDEIFLRIGLPLLSGDSVALTSGALTTLSYPPCGTRADLEQQWRRRRGTFLRLAREGAAAARAEFSACEADVDEQLEEALLDRTRRDAWCERVDHHMRAGKRSSKGRGTKDVDGSGGGAQQPRANAAETAGGLFPLACGITEEGMSSRYSKQVEESEKSGTRRRENEGAGAGTGAGDTGVDEAEPSPGPRDNAAPPLSWMCASITRSPADGSVTFCVEPPANAGEEYDIASHTRTWVWEGSDAEGYCLLLLNRRTLSVELEQRFSLSHPGGLRNMLIALNRPKPDCIALLFCSHWQGSGGGSRSGGGGKAVAVDTANAQRPPSVRDAQWLRYAPHDGLLEYVLGRCGVAPPQLPRAEWTGGEGGGRRPRSAKMGAAWDGTPASRPSTAPAPHSSVAGSPQAVDWSAAVTPSTQRPSTSHGHSFSHNATGGAMPFAHAAEAAVEQWYMLVCVPCLENMERAAEGSGARLGTSLVWNPRDKLYDMVDSRRLVRLGIRDMTAPRPFSSSSHTNKGRSVLTDLARGSGISFAGGTSPFAAGRSPLAIGGTWRMSASSTGGARPTSASFTTDAKSPFAKASKPSTPEKKPDKAWARLAIVNMITKANASAPAGVIYDAASVMAVHKRRSSKQVFASDVSLMQVQAVLYMHRAELTRVFLYYCLLGKDGASDPYAMTLRQWMGCLDDSGLLQNHHCTTLAQRVFTEASFGQMMDTDLGASGSGGGGGHCHGSEPTTGCLQPARNDNSMTLDNFFEGLVRIANKVYGPDREGGKLKPELDFSGDVFNLNAAVSGRVPLLSEPFRVVVEKHVLPRARGVRGRGGQDEFELAMTTAPARAKRRALRHLMLRLFQAMANHVTQSVTHKGWVNMLRKGGAIGNQLSLCNAMQVFVDAKGGERTFASRAIMTHPHLSFDEFQDAMARCAGYFYGKRFTLTTSRRAAGQQLAVDLDRFLQPLLAAFDLGSSKRRAFSSTGEDMLVAESLASIQQSRARGKHGGRSAGMSGQKLTFKRGVQILNAELVAMRSLHGGNGEDTTRRQLRSAPAGRLGTL